MGLDHVAAAMKRIEAVLERRPGMGWHDDSPATARWEGGTRVVTRSESGMRVTSDMPVELGGSGDQVTPGWLFRSGVAACATTTIAMAAAAAGVELATLEVRVTSHSDTRGILGMVENGEPVYPGPHDLQLHVRVSAPGVSPERLHALVEGGLRCAPIPNAVQGALPMALNVELDA